MAVNQNIVEFTTQVTLEHPQHNIFTEGQKVSLGIKVVKGDTEVAHLYPIFDWEFVASLNNNELPYDPIELPRDKDYIWDTLGKDVGGYDLSVKGVPNQHKLYKVILASNFDRAILTDLIAFANHETVVQLEEAYKKSKDAPKNLQTIIQENLHGEISPISTRVIVNPRPVSRQDTVPVTLRRTLSPDTPDLALWMIIQYSTDDLLFENYNDFMNIVLCPDENDVNNRAVSDLMKNTGIKGDPKSFRNSLRDNFGHFKNKSLPFIDMDNYRALKNATEAFLRVNCAVGLNKSTFEQLNYHLISRKLERNVTQADAKGLFEQYKKQINGNSDSTIPYLALIQETMPDVKLLPNTKNVDDASLCLGILRSKFTQPCFLELLWSYWMEEGMLVQTMNAITTRFQNIRSKDDRDPLALLEIDPLRGLNNLLWGQIQDEQHRLSMRRRIYEYDHHYGLTLQGQAAPRVRGADSRSKFLDSFHNLLHLATIFYRDDDDTTHIADGFPVLNALLDVHLLLTEGAHNQYGDLPTTARHEMLMQQWILARPEFREFLPTRLMVAMPEPWMPRVDAMKTLKGWTDTSILHFRNLAIYGEKILLSIRYGAWSNVSEREDASNWARYWRDEIQGYIHAYRTVTGVDLTAEVNDERQAMLRALPPSIHIRNRQIARYRRQRAA